MDEVPGVPKKPFLCVCASLNSPNGQKGPLHIYTVRRIQWTWFDENLPSSFWVMVFTQKKWHKDGRSYGPTVGRGQFHSSPLPLLTDGRGTKYVYEGNFHSSQGEDIQRTHIQTDSGVMGNNTIDRCTHLVDVRGMLRQYLYCASDAVALEVSYSPYSQ